MCLIAVTLFTLFVTWNAYGSPSLTPCEDNYFVVKETQKTNSLTCGGLEHQKKVDWGINTSNVNLSIGSCYPDEWQFPDPCNFTDDSLRDTFSLNMLSRDASVLNVDPLTHGSALVDTLSAVSCWFPGSRPNECRIDLIYPAEVGKCSVQFTRWSVTGRCDVTKTYSSRGNYSCQCFYMIGNLNFSLESTNMVTSPQDGKYVTGVCTISTPLPSVSGNYSYHVVITPGKVHVDATFTSGSVIERPNTPSVSCTPSDYVPENTDLSCTCHTSSVGQPEGRLRWVWGTAGNINNTINTGSYGNQTLRMEPQTLQRGDDGRQFRCDVEWASVYPGQVHTARVGYAASRVAMTINSDAQNTTVIEGQNVTYFCQSGDALPTPNVTLTSDVTGRLLAGGPPSLTYTQRSVKCEDGGQYTCTADNGMGQPAKASATLFVNCAPRRKDANLPFLVFSSKPTSVNFDVTAYPVPDTVSFAFLGSSQDNITTPKPELKDITLKGSCQKGDNVHMSKCAVTVVDMTSSAAGVYHVTVDNRLGQASFSLPILFIESSGSFNLPYFAIAVGVSAVLAVVVMAVVVVVVVVWRRRWILPCSDEKDRTAAGTDLCTPENEETTNIRQPADAQAETPSAPYEHLRLSQVGERNVYSTIGTEEKSSAGVTENGGVYENISHRYST